MSLIIKSHELGGLSPDLWQNKILSRLPGAQLNELAYVSKALHEQVWTVRNRLGLVKMRRVQAAELGNIDTLRPFQKLVILDLTSEKQLEPLLKSKRFSEITNIAFECNSNFTASSFHVISRSVYEKVLRMPLLKTISIPLVVLRNFDLNKLEHIEQLTIPSEFNAPHHLDNLELHHLKILKGLTLLTSWWGKNIEKLGPHPFQQSFVYAYGNFPKLRCLSGFSDSDQFHFERLAELQTAPPEVVQYALSLRDTSDRSFLLHLVTFESREQEVLASLKATLARKELQSLFGPEELAIILSLAVVRDWEFAVQLLEAGADVNYVVEGLTALQRFVLARCSGGTCVGDGERVGFLLQKGADPNIAQESSELPLLVAISTVHKDIILKLLTAPHPANALLEGRGFDKRCEKMYGTQLEKRLGSCTYFKHCYTMSPLQALAYRGVSDNNMVDLLISRANVNAKNDKNQSLLQCVLDLDIDWSSKILQRVEDVNHQDAFGETALNALLRGIVETAEDIASLKINHDDKVVFAAGRETKRLDAKYDLNDCDWSALLGHPTNLKRQLNNFIILLSRGALLKRPYGTLGALTAREIGLIVNKIRESMMVCKAIIDWEYDNGDSSSEKEIFDVENELCALINPSELSFLQIFCKNGHLHELRKKMQNIPIGAIVDSDRQFTLLHLAAEAGSSTTMSFLLSERAAEIALVDAEGRTPLDVAVDMSHVNTIALLATVRSLSERKPKKPRLK